MRFAGAYEPDLNGAFFQNVRRPASPSGLPDASVPRQITVT